MVSRNERTGPGNLSAVTSQGSTQTRRREKFLPRAARLLSGVCTVAMFAWLGGAIRCSGQTDPAAQSLPFSFTSQSGSTLQAGMAMHRFGTNTASIPTTRTTSPGTGDLPYNSGSTTGGWRDEGTNGISMLASGSQAAGAMVVAINTTGKSGIQVSWRCGTVLNQSSRDDSIALQYRVGTSGNFTDVGTTTTYTSTGQSNGTFSGTFTETLPAAAENQSIVEVRWIYWESVSTSGSRDRVAVDDISIIANSSSATKVRVETQSNGGGIVVPAQSVSGGGALTAYSISRDAGNVFVANVAATWSLINKTGGVVDGDLVPAVDGKSAVFTGNQPGSAVIHAVVGGLTSVDSGTITVTTTPTPPTGSGIANPTAVAAGSNVLLTVTVTAGANPASTGLAVTNDLSAIGGSTNQNFYDDGTHGDVTPGDNVFSFQTTVPDNLPGGLKTFPGTVSDAQGRSSATSISLQVFGPIAIFHANDNHARVTPHYWVAPKHAGTNSPFELVGGVAYTGAKFLELTTNQPDALVLDGGDISEGNPVGDWNGPGFPVGTFGNGTIVEYFKLLDAKLRAIPGRGGRGLDAMVVGNHDIRDISYITNMQDQTAFPVISINICSNGTHNPYFKPYVIVNVNGNKVGIVGYTTESSDSPEAAVTNLIDVVPCDWSSTDSTRIHFADYVNELRNVQGCNLVILLTHMGHSGLCTVTTANPTPILVDNSVAKIPEIVVSGHWHTFAESVWEPTSLNYKTIFTEAGSFTHFVSELRVNGLGKYVSSTNYAMRNADITPDADIANLIQTRKDEYTATSPTYGLDQIIGYTADDLLLDNYMKWWSADEYPWSGNNTAGNWICDAVQWKATNIFGVCDLAVESGGGVRSDIPAGPVTYTQIYETFPWPDDTIYLVNMTGQEIWDYFKQHGCDVALSHDWHVTAFDGVPTSITFSNGIPIDLAHVYKVAINNYMYLHDTVPFSDPNPQTSTNLARTALVEFTALYPQNAPYHAGGSRYTLNTDFSGGYRAVITMMNDADSNTSFDDGFIRFLTATPETLEHRGTPQVPVSLVDADGSFIQSNRLSENEWYRSYLGFRTNVLKVGDIVETWGKGSFFDGDPEFVDQEGIQADGIEFKIVGHDDSLAKPSWVSDIGTVMDDNHKNHYVKFLAKKTGTSSVVDQFGNALTVKDVTAFANKTLPGAVNDLLVLSGVPTSENFGMRFRCDNAVLAASLGISSFPAASTVRSHVDALPPSTTSGPLTLTATALVNAQNVFNLGPTDDATVSSGNPTTPNGTSTTLFLQSGTTGFGNERTWLKFDLSSLPNGSTISNATVQLYCWSAGTTPMPVVVAGASSDSWTEAALTWNTQPAFGSDLDTETLAANTVNLYYSWDVTSFAQSKLAGNKLVSLVARPVTENIATNLFYKFDSKEFGSTPPVLTVTLQPSGPLPTIAQVEFFYRYSSDNTNWSAWNSAGVDVSAPYSVSFNYPNGYGYYEFYSIATDSNSGVEPAPPAAQAFVHYAAAPPYNTAAFVSLGGLSQTYDGGSHPASVATVPPNLGVAVTYDGSSTPPKHAGTYAVAASITSAGFNGAASGTLNVGKGSQTISFDPLATKTVGDPDFNLTATASSGLPITYNSSNPGVGMVSGNTVTIVAPGTTTITASQTGDSDYFAASPVDQSLTVNAAGGGSGEDVPLMPAWGVAILAVLLFCGSVWDSSRSRTAASNSKKS
jgi:2',3'-cyclic-nucleotide 2'-phosphodiesterase (5'-nucleotidase family)